MDDKQDANGNVVPRTGLACQAFCVALAKTGECRRSPCDSPNDLANIIADSKITWINYTLDDLKVQGEEIAASFGFSSGLLTKLLESSYSEYEDRDTELGLLLPAATVKNLDVTVNPLIILMRKNLILTMSTGEVFRLVRFSRYADTFFRKIPKTASWQDAMTLALIRILDENNDRNFDHLREIEAQADDLSKFLMDPKSSRDKMGHAIYDMKHALITYMNVLWASLDVVNSLRYGDAEVITDNVKILQRINVLSSDLTTHLELSEHMSEVLASGLEVLQSIYNNQLQILNNRLALLVAYLTIIGTALLVPNTIATVAGNNMFEFTSADQRWYLALIIVSTIVATAASWWIVHRMGLLPKSPE
jgi:magnesium transporter